MQTIRHFYSPPLVASPRFHLHGIGIGEEMRSGLVNRPGGTGDYLFMYFYDEVTLPDLCPDAPAAAGTLVLWEPGDGHRYGAAGRPWRHTWLHGEGELLAACGLAPRTPLALGGPGSMERWLGRLHEEAGGPHPPDGGILCRLAECWLRDLRRCLAPEATPPPVPAAFQALRRYLDTHYDRKLTLPELAGRMHLSVPHFCSEFRRWFGIAPIAYVIRRRLEEAAFLLRDHNLRVGEIARQVGYGDIYYFSRLFKQRYGRSPRTYRRELAAGVPRAQRSEA
jgi:AraC-like DNA-binding protein